MSNTTPAGSFETIPVLPLRDIVVFPHMIVPLFVGRDKSIRALEEVMKGDRYILLATQKIAADDDPATDAIFTTGTLNALAAAWRSLSLAALRPLLAEAVPRQTSSARFGYYA